MEEILFAHSCHFAIMSLPISSYFQELGSKRPREQEENTDNHHHEEKNLQHNNKKQKEFTFAELELWIPESWKMILNAEFSKAYWKNLKRKLLTESQQYQVFPPPELIFNALELTPWDDVKVVIIGQDPYHNNGQAEGLCFSVPQGIKKPSSLNNIFKELKSDLGEDVFTIPNHGNLRNWAKQGVLLLNTALTVRAHKANSHKSLGWRPFTNSIIQMLNKNKSGVIFLLWGKHAQSMMKFIDKTKHHVLSCAHPSGLSAHRGFFGCKHFSQANELLDASNAINWEDL